MSPENYFVCFRGQDKFGPGHGEQCRNVLHCPEGKKEKNKNIIEFLKLFCCPLDKKVHIQPLSTDLPEPGLLHEIQVCFHTASKDLKISFLVVSPCLREP